MPEIAECHICSGTESIFIQSSYVYLNSVELNLVKCAQCGLIYLNPQPAGDEIEKLYSKEYFLKWYSSEEKREFSKNFFRKLLSQNGLTTNTGHSVLDIGCGMGYFLEVAREWGWDAKGVEISPYAARYCREKLNFDVHCGTLETANYHNDYFDIITAFDFLEHISELSRFFPALKRVLKPDGMFIVVVPNYDGLVFQLERTICKLKKAPLSNVPEHITYFSLSTFKKLLENYGFIAAKILTTNANDDYQYLSIRGNPKAALRAFITKICYILGKLSNRREAILAVAKKSFHLSH